MQIKKVVQCKIHNLTNIKEQILNTEYDDYQNLCQEVSQCIDNDYLPDKPYFMFKRPNRYSATVWGAIQSVSKKKQFGDIGKQPLYLRNDVFSVKENKTTISKYWLKLPTKQKHGGIWLPIIVPKKYQECLKLKICDSKIAKRDNGWFLLLTVEKDIEIRKSYSNLVAIDLGIRHIASVVRMSDKKPIYLGNKIREIRGHYYYLRKQLGKKKSLQGIRKLKNRERRIIDNEIKQISRSIVNLAKETNSAIVSGNIKGIRKNGKQKGRRFRRKLNSFPFHKLNAYIKHMANWEGLLFITITEAYTSKTCHVCGAELVRSGKHMGLVKCPQCQYQDNANRNGAINIGLRGRGSMSRLGASITDQARTSEANL
jgi:putative transposase